MFINSQESHLGLFDGVESLVQHYVYSPFGKIIRIENAGGSDITATPMVDNFYNFTGREYDKESGLYYYRARFYDSETGRFIQSDPHPGRVGAPKTHISSFIYTVNNPINSIDPSGKSSFGNFLETVAITAAIVTAAYFTGGAAVAYFGATGASAIAIGATAGALAGGLVGGIGYSATGLGSFRKGFIYGAVTGAFVGGSAGYKAGLANESSSTATLGSTFELSTAPKVGNAFFAAGACAVGVYLFARYFLKPFIDKNFSPPKESPAEDSENSSKAAPAEGTDTNSSSVNTSNGEQCA